MFVPKDLIDTTFFQVGLASNKRQTIASPNVDQVS